MLCPTCHSDQCRRSRRRHLADKLIGLTGMRPWRCRICETRFYAGVAPLRFFANVYCPGCGNMDLQPMARDRVAGWLGPLYRLLRVRAYRCEACRNRFFSTRKFRRITPLDIDFGPNQAPPPSAAPVTAPTGNITSD